MEDVEVVFLRNGFAMDIKIVLELKTRHHVDQLGKEMLSVLPAFIRDQLVYQDLSFDLNHFQVLQYILVI